MKPSEFIIKATRRVVWAVKGRPILPHYLEMVWPQNGLEGLPDASLAEGYRLRQFDSKDTPHYYEMFAAAGMGHPPLDYWDKHLLPDGFFIVEHVASNALAAACFASHHPTPRHPRGGNFGWLAVDPKHRGQQLGHAISAAVTGRLISAGYQRIYLETLDFRLAAIAIYLKMGWLPLLYLPEMEARWLAVCNALDWPFTPDRWPQ